MTRSHPRPSTRCYGHPIRGGVPRTDVLLSDSTAREPSPCAIIFHLYQGALLKGTSLNQMVDMLIEFEPGKRSICTKCIEKQTNAKSLRSPLRGEDGGVSCPNPAYLTLCSEMGLITLLGIVANEDTCCS